MTPQLSTTLPTRATPKWLNFFWPTLPLTSICRTLGRTPLGLACQIGKVSVAQLQVCDPRVNMTLVIIVKGPRCGLLLALDAIKQWSG